jgi:TonB family protein
MKSSHSALAFSVLLLIGTFNLVQSQQTPEKATQKAAESWLRRIDSGKYAQAWDEASPFLKKRIIKKDWERVFMASANNLKELGDTKSRRFVKAEHVKSLPSINNQEGVVLEYSSTFEGHKTIDETVEMVLEKDNEWRVANYEAVGTAPGGRPRGITESYPISDSQRRIETAVDTKPVLLNHPEPKYTEAARKNGVQGIVEARVLVSIDGTVKQIRITRELPDGLNDEAMKVMYLLRYKPAMKNGQPVAYWTNVEIEFNLRNK